VTDEKEPDSKVQVGVIEGNNNGAAVEKFALTYWEVEGGGRRESRALWYWRG
jgi:hypothetical protein